MLLVVGPNNAGKSTALLELHQRLISEQPPGFVIRQVTRFREGTAEDLRSWLAKFYSLTEREPHSYFVAKDNEIRDCDVSGLWESLPERRQVYLRQHSCVASSTWSRG